MVDFEFEDGDSGDMKRQGDLSAQQDPAAAQQMQVVNQNPFDAAMQKYGPMALPETPLNFSTNMAESMLNDNEVPEKFRKNFWFVFHKDNTLTFLDEERRTAKLINFDIIRIDMINTMPYYDYDFDLEMKLGMLRNVFETKLDRAFGIRGTGVKNERLTLQSQFSENRQIQETVGGSSGGFFKRLLGRK
jgi:hypothetical protein